MLSQFLVAAEFEFSLVSALDVNVLHRIQDPALFHGAVLQSPIPVPGQSLCERFFFTDQNQT